MSTRRGSGAARTRFSTALPDILDAEVGDEVVLLGRSGDVEISLAGPAEQWGVSTYDLSPAVGKTLPHRNI
ncbi:hypothetical protein [Bosea sp. Root483D1]|uniref:hypothetical protein n=1 Tax=Bosea sp. Root483D1 TaxID=1736544 RepID=UPI0012E3850E|nr:hypothetical protein [Bosea sp. Root483D1]